MSAAEDLLALHLRAAGVPRKRVIRPNSACSVCQEPFYASPGHLAQGWGKYCSFKCRSIGLHIDPDDNVTCKGCGEKFYVKQYAILHDKGKVFCSMECQQRLQGIKTLTCKKCLTTFERYPSQGKGAYCSKKCAYLASRKDMVTLTCVSCKKNFDRPPHVLLKNKGSGSFCSNRCKAAFMSASSITVSGAPRGTRATRGGFRDDIGIYVRSSWEANYARYLNWLVANKKIVSWEYEPRTFEFTAIKRGSRFYTPDFRIVGIDESIEYHEVKGYMDERSATKLKRMSKYYPEIKMIIIAEPQYREVRNKVGAMIEGWE